MAAQWEQDVDYERQYRSLSNLEVPILTNLGS